MVISQTFEIIIDGITIFSAFLVRDTIISVIDILFPNKDKNIYSTIFYTLCTVLSSVLFIVFVRNIILKKKKKSKLKQSENPVSYNLFD
jgi:NADH:ubiquinone oxidoreductase subunit 4 (subunit M)